IEDPPTDDLPNLKKNEDLYVEETPSVRVMYVAMDQHAEPTPGIPLDKNPLKDKRVREALSLAINRDAIVDRVMGGVAKAAGNVLPYPMFGSSKEHAEAPKADTDKAKALLKEAGYPDGFTITLGSPRSEERRVGKEWRSRWSRKHEKEDIHTVERGEVKQ